MANDIICPRCRRPYNGRYCFKCGFQFTETNTKETQNINETQQEVPAVIQEPEQPAAATSDDKQEKTLPASKADANNAEAAAMTSNNPAQQAAKKTESAQTPNALLKAKVIKQSNHHQKKDTVVEVVNNAPEDAPAKTKDDNLTAEPQTIQPAQQPQTTKPEAAQPQIKRQTVGSTSVEQAKVVREAPPVVQPPKTTSILQQPTRPLPSAQTKSPQQTVQNTTGNLQAALAARNPYSSIAAPPPVKRPAASGVTGIKKAPAIARPTPTAQSASNETEKALIQDRPAVQPVPQQPPRDVPSNQNASEKQVINPGQSGTSVAHEDDQHKKDAVSANPSATEDFVDKSAADSAPANNEDGQNGPSPEAPLPSNDWRNSSLSGSTDDTEDEEYEEDENPTEDSAPAENDKQPVSKEQKEEDALFDSMFHPKSDKVENASSKKKRGFNPFRKKDKKEPDSEGKETQAQTESEDDNDNAYNPNHDNYYDDVPPDIYSEEDKITAASIMKVVGFILGVIFFIIAMIFYI